MSFLAAIGRAFLGFLTAVGRLAIFAAAAVSHSVRPPIHFRLVGRQLVDIGDYSLPVVGLTALFTGMVLALQSYTGFARFNAEGAVATVVVLSMTRELGPVLAGLMVAGRIGASSAAEIGTMRVTEQIDALETLGYNPTSYLAVPRIVAGVLMFPVVVAFADAVGILGGWITALNLLDMSTPQFVRGLRLFFDPFDIRYSLIKASSFGLAVTSIGCYYGFTTAGGAEAVGRNTTQAVVVSSMMILVLDAFWAVALL